MTAAEIAALRALRDCGAIRADGIAGPYVELRRKGLAFTSAVPGTTRRVFRLSETGKATATRLPRAGFNPKFGG